jgi:lipopolysaccharide/colanic/teichoic acid biosynthesis glycosyltransferase
LERRKPVSAAVDGIEAVRKSSAAVRASQSYPVAPVLGAQQAKTVQEVIKRLLDIALASVAIAVAALPLALMALAIKLDSKGPIFFKQQRVGRNGELFAMYKFRSMVVDAEALQKKLWSSQETDAPLFKVRHDPRRTRVGEAMRRFSIDEFPQLLNVLQGHMSIVGPRPALPDEVTHYSAYEANRLLAAPGMTGLWQVSGRSLLSFEEMVELDLRYVSGWSLWLDLQVMIRTIPTVISGKGAW